MEVPAASSLADKVSVRGCLVERLYRDLYLCGKAIAMVWVPMLKGRRPSCHNCGFGDVDTFNLMESSATTSMVGVIIGNGVHSAGGFTDDARPIGATSGGAVGKPGM